MAITVKLPSPEMDVEVLERLCREAREAARPKPVEGQVYRRKDSLSGNPTTDEYGNRCYLRRFVNGVQEWQKPSGEWETEPSPIPLAQLVPYTPPPTFRVGEWVRCNTHGRLMKINEVRGVTSGNKPMYICVSARDTYLDCYLQDELSLATPDEIAAATRIVPKVGMLLRRKSDGSIWRVYHCYGILALIAKLVYEPLKNNFQSDVKLSTEDYDILPRYTIEGVQP